VLTFLVLSLFQFVCLVASYLPGNDGFQQHAYAALLLLLGGLLFSVYLLRTSREKLRRPLPLATLVGLIFGVFLGWISNLPYYLLLLLALGIFGPFDALTSSYPSEFAEAYRWPDFWLATLAVLLSFLLYALVAYLVTQRTGDFKQGLWGALLSAFITIVVTICTMTIINLIQAFLVPSPQILPLIVSFQYLPSIPMLLSVARIVHAVFAGLVGAGLAVGRLRWRSSHA
jgi:hypothetical protein